MPQEQLGPDLLPGPAQIQRFRARRRGSNLPAGPCGQREREARVTPRWRHADVGDWPAQHRRAKTHATARPRQITRGYGFTSMQASKRERRRFQRVTGTAPATSTAAAATRPRRARQTGSEGGGKGGGEERMLTLDACASTARQEEARGGRNRRRNPPGSEKRIGMASSIPVLPFRFLARG